MIFDLNIRNNIKLKKIQKLINDKFAGINKKLSGITNSKDVGIYITLKYKVSLF